MCLIDHVTNVVLFMETLCKDNVRLLDAHVGERLKILRLAKNKTLQEIGDIINVSFQQIQKYERGINKLSCSKLYILANALGVPVKYFFDSGYSDSSLNNFTEQASHDEYKLTDHVSEPELSRLIKYYARIDDSNARKIIIDLIRKFSPSPVLNTH